MDPTTLDRFLPAGRRGLPVGLLLPLKSARFLLSHPRLWRWAILPALISVALFVLAAVLLITNSPRILGWIWTRPEVTLWWEWILLVLWHVVLLVVVAGSVVLSYFLVLLTSGVIASPFNDRLSQEVERSLTGEVLHRREQGSRAAESLRSIGTSLGRLLAYAGCMLPLLALNLLPGAGNLAYTVLAMCTSAFFLALEHTDNTLDRRGYGFGDKISLVVKYKGLTGGFGLGTALLLLIPVINLLAMPVAIVGGTFLGMRVDEEES